jgi:hypothetical protein
MVLQGARGILGASLLEGGHEMPVLARLAGARRRLAVAAVAAFTALAGTVAWAGSGARTPPAPPPAATPGSPDR